MEIIHYAWENSSFIMGLTREHMMLVSIAVGLAILLGVPIGVLIMRLPALAPWVLGLATVILTTPSIALFGLMIPLFSLINQGIGYVPAISAVFLYSLLPIIRNTHAAFQQIDPGIRESCKGLGMSFFQRLCWVELPLAIPLIFCGIRTAVVMNIGVMAIASTIGAGGLGLLILHGISQSDIRQLIVGAVMISLLAIVMDLILSCIQHYLTPKGIRS